MSNTLQSFEKKISCKEVLEHNTPLPENIALHQHQRTIRPLTLWFSRALLLLFLKVVNDINSFINKSIL